MLKKLVIGLLILLLVGTGSLVFLANNESFLKKQVSGLVRDYAGAELDIEGPLDLSLGALTIIEARDIRFSNPAWKEQPQIVFVGRLLATLRPASLFDDRFVIENIEIDDCRVDLAVDAEDRKNWQLEIPGNLEEEQEPPTTVPGGPPPVIIERLMIRNCTLTHSAPQRDNPLVVTTDSVDLTLQQDRSIALQISSAFDEIPVSASGQMGPMYTLWQGGAFSHELKLTAGKVNLSSEGSFQDVQSLSGADISMEFNGPEITHVIGLFALPTFSEGAFDFRLDLDTQGAMTNIDIVGDLGSLDANIEGELDRLLHPTSGQLVASVNGPDLGALASAFNIDGLTSEPFRISADATVENGNTSISPLVLTVAGDKLEVDGTVGAFPEFSPTTVNLSFVVEDADIWVNPFLQLPGSLGNASVNARLKVDETSKVSINGEIGQAGNQLSFNGGLGAFPDFVRQQLDFELDSPSLASIGAIAGMEGLPDQPISLSGSVTHGDGNIQLDGLQAELDGNRLTVDGNLNLADEYRGSSLNLKADIPSTSSLASLFGVKDVPDQPLMVKAVVTPEGEGLHFRFDDSTLGELALDIDGKIADLSEPALIDADFDIRLPRLSYFGFLAPDLELPDLPFSATGKARNMGESVQLSNSRVQLGQTEANFDLTFHPGENLAGSSAKFSVRGPDLGELWTFSNSEKLPSAFLASGSWARSDQGDRFEAVEVGLGEARLKLDGTVTDLATLTGIQARTELNVPDLSIINDFLEQEFDPIPVSLSTSLSGNLEQFEIDDLAARIGESDLSGQLRVDRRAKPRIAGTLHSNLLDVRPFLEDPEQQAAGETATEPAPSAASGDKVFDTTPMRPEEQSPVNLDLNVTVNRSIFHFTELHDVRLNMVADDGLVRLSPFAFRDMDGAELSGSFDFDSRVEIPTLSIDIDGKDLRLGIAAPENQDPATYPPMEIHVLLQGAGVTQHDLASSLNGKIRIFWGSGLYGMKGLGFLFSDFLTELLTALNPFAETSEYSKLECGVLAADIVDGLMTIEPILFQDERMTIVSQGTIDLDPEAIDLTFKTKPRKGFGLSPGVIINSMVKVGGTMAAPGVELDPGSAVVSGGAAVATVGLSLLAKSFADRFLSSKDPCGDTRKVLDEKDRSAGGGT